MRKGLMLVLALVSPFHSLDLAVRDVVQASRGKPFPDRLMQGATDAGRPVTVFGILLGVAAFDPIAGPATARIALAAVLATNLAVESLKRITNRARPDGEHKRSNASFPSSHAANAAALATILWRRWPRLGPAFGAAALLVAFSRIYLDRHWLTDVVAGLAIGVLVALASVRWLWGWAERRHRRRITVETPPPL